MYIRYQSLAGNFSRFRFLFDFGRQLYYVGGSWFLDHQQGANHAMSYNTEDTLKQLWCPFAGQHCRGSECAVFRWRPFSTADPGYVNAIRSCIKDRKMKYSQAPKYVNAHREEFGLPTHPVYCYCGLGGEKGIAGNEKRGE